MAANDDYKDLFRLFSQENVEYLLVGAHAVAFYAEPRYTKDLDVLVRPTPDNASRVWTALTRFGAPLTDVTVDQFTVEDMIYQIGVAPNRIDIMMSVAGVDFEAAWPNRTESTYDGVPIHILGREDLIRSKQAAARPQDLLDATRLQDSQGT